MTYAPLPTICPRYEVPMAVGTVVSVTYPNGQRWQGRVVWVCDSHYAVDEWTPT